MLAAMNILGAVDALALLFLAGSVLFLWMLWRFIRDDLDLGADRRQQADDVPLTTTTDAPGVAAGPGDGPARRPRKAA